MKTSSRPPVFSRFLSCFVAVLVLAVAWLGSGMVHAAPYGRDGMATEFVQPDGTKLNLRVFGDEHYARTETADGYTVFFSPAANAYYFAQVSENGENLINSGHRVGQADPAALGLARHLDIKPEVARARAREARRSWEASTGLRARWDAVKARAAAQRPRVLPDGSLDPASIHRAPPAFTALGNKVGLTLLIDFPDVPGTVPVAEVQNFLNGDNYTSNGNNGSVKKYFHDNSNGLLTYTNTLIAYVRVPNVKSYYNDTTKVDGPQGNLLIKDALDVLKARPDYNSTILPTLDSLTTDAFGFVVAFNVFYAGTNGGRWGAGLWPHSWVLQTVGPQSLGNNKWVNKYQITNMGGSLTIGTFCHENGHMLCDYPDIYDYDSDSWGGAGQFCLMNSGASGNAFERNPSNICAYLKYCSGWCEVIPVEAGTSLFAAADATRGMAKYNRVYLMENPASALFGDPPTEYFIMEARHKSGRDANLPCSGIAIWHVDELGNGDLQSLDPNTLHENYEVSLEQADGRFDFQKDPNGQGDTGNEGDATDLFYLGNGAGLYTNKFTNATTPNSKWWDGSPSSLDVNTFSAPAAAMTFEIGDPLLPNTIRVDSPNGGEFRNHGVTYQIKWATNIPGTVRVELLKGGATVQVLTPSMPNTGTLVWEIPSTLEPGSDYRIKVASNENTALSATDTSDADFSIVGVPPQITSPLRAYGTVGQPFDYQVTANNNPTSIVVTNLPPGLSVDATGHITGTPTSVGSNNGRFATIITARNGYGANVVTLSILIDATTMSLAEALDSPAMSWTTGGGSGWKSMIPSAGLTKDGVDSAQARWTDNDQESWIETTVSGPGNVSFWWKVSSEGGYDELRFTLNGQPVSGVNGIPAISGEMGWVQKSVYVGAGFSTLRWTYRKDRQTSVGQDSAWLDQVQFTSVPLASDIRVDQPLGTPLTDGVSQVSFGSVVAGGMAEREFTVLNFGTGQLDLGAITINGANAADFSVFANPAPGIVPGDRTTFTIRFNPSAAGVRTAALHLASNDPDEAPFDINLTGTVTSNQEFAGGFITIPVGGNANPRPSSVAVANVSGTIQTIRLKLNGLAHNDPDDIDMYLEAPNGKFCTIMSDAGGDTVVAAPGRNLVFEDAAAAKMQPRIGIGAASNFKPTDYNEEGTTTNWLGVNNVTQYDASRPAGTEVYTLNELATGGVNGTWKLWVYDDVSASGAGSINSWALEIIVAVPEISVQKPVGTELTSGGASLNFGTVSYGSSAAAMTVTVKNTGTGSLNGLAVTKDGAASADFTVGALGSTTLAAGASTTFTVVFTPAAIGSRNAAIHIASNDADENPFHINLVGSGSGTALQDWRQTAFGTPAATGTGADLADPDQDGLVNLVEYAFGLNPLLGSSRKLPAPAVQGGNLVISFTRPVGVSGVTYAVEWSPTLVGGSWQAVPNTGTGNNFVFSKPMSGQIKGFMRIKVSNP